jgi:hypothetical protein
MTSSIAAQFSKEERAPHPIGRLSLGLPLVQLGFGLGVHLHQQVLVSDLQVVEQTQ